MNAFLTTLSASGPPRVEAVPHPNDESRVIGYNRAEVRTVMNGMPITGAHCRMIAPHHSLEFYTPSQIAVPVMRRPVGPATLTCKFGDHSTSTVMHASRKLETRDLEPDIPFGFIIGRAAALASDATNFWIYFKNGSTLTLDLAS